MTYSDTGNGRFRNPVLFADYSDPDVIRVGDTFYLTASSFNYTPGLPILVSKDLVNWKLKGYALENIGEERYKIPRHSEGVWAPAIRFHEGMFYIYYGMPDEGLYVVRARDPLGEWEKPRCILKGKGLIDPCPFWDEDGKAYIVHGYAKSRIGFKSILGIFEMSSDGLRAITEDHFIFDGNSPEHAAVTIEGPKVYKRGGYYYILAPAGGVREGWQAALRSRDIHGPYELKKVMDQGNTVINGPHQGGLVDTQSGDEWFLHFQDRGLYGRICHLQPVSWKDDWPVIGADYDGDGCGEPVMESVKPATGHETDEAFYLEASDDFKDGRYSLLWQWLGDHDESFFGKAKENGLRMYALSPSGDNEPIIWKSANVLTQKIIYPEFTAVIKADLSKLGDGDRAGVCMTGGQYITAYLKNTDGTFYIKTAMSEGGDADKQEKESFNVPLGDMCKKLGVSEDYALSHVIFRMRFVLSGHDDKKESLYYRNVSFTQGESAPRLRIEIGFGDAESDAAFTDLEADYVPSDHTWVGAKIGIYALGNGKVGGASGYADFADVTVREE